MSDVLFQKLKRIGKLPTPPGVVVRLLELTQAEDVKLKDIVDTIGMDPGLSAKILKFANSPMAGLPRSVTSLQQAISLIGIRGVKMMALSFSLVSSSAVAACEGFDQSLFWSQSLACGVASRVLAERSKCHAAEEAFMAGLLSQIGRNVLAVGMGPVYSKVLSLAPNRPRALPPVESKALGSTYPKIGASLLAEWAIPARLVEAISAFRDDKPVTGPKPTLAQLLNCAEAAASIICPDPGDQKGNPEEYCQLLAQLCGVEHDEAITLLATIAASVEEMRTMLEMPRGHTRTAAEIEIDLRDRIAELTLATSIENQTFQQENQELLRRALTDRLTGLNNRAAFDERLSIELERASRTGTAFALILLDVDKFKNFNDTHGHLAGDRVLQAVAVKLDETVRKIDFVARYGGEEFAVIAPDATPKGAIQLAERLRSAVEESEVEFEGKRLHVTISLGVAAFQVPAREVTPAVAIKLADEQLYAAKGAGRNKALLAVDGKPFRLNTAVPA
jgi:diguanylate cyclase (GGDEF)-like protein